MDLYKTLLAKKLASNNYGLSHYEKLFSRILKGNRLPNEYQKVDYIESNGTQYIDTGVIGKNGLDIYAKYKSTDIYQTRLMAVSTGLTEIRLGLLLSQSAGNIVNQYNKNNIILTDYVGDLTNIHTLENKDGTLIYDGRVVNQIPSETFTTEKNLYLFASNSATIAYGYVKMYEAFIKENNKLVRHFIPAVKKSNGKQMFDYTRTDGIIADKYINQSGALVSANDYYISYPISVVVGETYTWRFNADSSSTTHTAPTVGFYDVNNNLISTAQHSNQIKYFNFTVPSNCAYIRCSVYTVNNAQQQAMLNKGSTPLRYETYIPDEVGMYDLSATSKNLYSATLQEGYYGDSDISYKTLTTDDRYRAFELQLKAGTYTINISADEGIRLLRCSNDIDKAVFVRTDNEPYTFVLTTDTTIYVSFRNLNTTNSFTNLKIMLNEGSTALPYEPYQKRFYTNDGTGEFGYEYNSERVEPTS